MISLICLQQLADYGSIFDTNKPSSIQATITTDYNNELVKEVFHKVIYWKKVELRNSTF